MSPPADEFKRQPARPGRLGRRVLSGRPEVVAPLLLGATLRTRTGEGTVALRITEVEAYGGVDEDAASHAHRGPTPRSGVMFERPGILYVYFVYGMHWCANIVCGPVGVGSAVLLRAGDVIDGVHLARERRRTSRSDADLARGPGNLTTALGISGVDTGTDLLADTSSIRLTRTPHPPLAEDVAVGPRIGIRREVDRPWRWWLRSARSVSRAPRPRPDTPR